MIVFSLKLKGSKGSTWNPSIKFSTFNSTLLSYIFNLALSPLLFKAKWHDSNISEKTLNVIMCCPLVRVWANNYIRHMMK